MNIWYISAYDQPRGHSSRTWDFSRELIKRGHQVTMFTNSYCHWTHKEFLEGNEKWRIEDIEGIRTVWLKTIHYSGNGFRRGLNMISNIWRLMQVTRIMLDRPDVVIGPSVPLGTGWAASRTADFKNSAFVFEVRDVWPIALVYNGAFSKNNPVYWIFRLIEKFLYKKAQRISTTMFFLLEHVADSGGDPEKVSWIPNGVNFERFDKDSIRYDGGRNLPLTVMYIGGFGVAHDVITIVKAANVLKERGDDRFKFIIIGDGPKRVSCEQEAVLCRLNNIEFRNSIPKADISRVQLEADILIACVTNSKTYRFGLNLNKIYDYFASARPVIFSGNAPNDLVSESGCGLNIPPEDPAAMAVALQKLANATPIERIEMGKKGRKYVEDNFDIQKLAIKMESLLLQAIQDKGCKCL